MTDRGKEKDKQPKQMTAARCPVTPLICMQSTNAKSSLKRKKEEKRKEKDEIERQQNSQTLQTSSSPPLKLPLADF